MSITVNAAELIDFPYKIYAYDSYYDKYYLVISKEDFGTDTTETNDHLTDLMTGLEIDISEIQGWYTVSNTAEAYLYTHTPSGWMVSLGYGKTGSSPYVKYLIPTNLTEYSESSLPSNFPEIDISNLESKLNKTTQTTNSALTIQSSVGTSYQQYQDGTIDLATLEANLKSALDQLNSLANKSGNTLSDQVAVNNAITYTQTIQENVILNTSPELQTVLDEIRNEVNTIYYQYINKNGLGDLYGYISMEEAIEQISTHITRLEYYISKAYYTSIADITAINATQNYIRNITDNIRNARELDKDVSEKSQTSDAEELEYLDNLEAETTDTIDTLKVKVDSSINQTQADQVKEQIIEPILQNTLLIKILPIAALFMVLAVTLGFKYRL